jgi:hypothetical protein
MRGTAPAVEGETLTKLAATTIRATAAARIRAPAVLDIG